MRASFSRLSFLRDHRWAPGRMSAYLDGDLTARRRGRLERHLAECRECRRLVAGLTQVLDALHLLDRPAGEQDGLRIASAVRGRLSEPPGT